MAQKFCTKCGAQLLETDEVCPKCGARTSNKVKIALAEIKESSSVNCKKFLDTKTNDSSNEEVNKKPVINKLFYIFGIIILVDIVAFLIFTILDSFTITPSFAFQVTSIMIACVCFFVLFMMTIVTLVKRKKYNIKTKEGTKALIFGIIAQGITIVLLGVSLLFALS